MNNYIEYAPIIVILIGYFIQYKIFVTPSELDKKLSKLKDDLDEKFVHKDVYDVTVSGLKDDVAEIKDKIDAIYNHIMGVGH